VGEAGIWSPDVLPPARQASTPPPPSTDGRCQLQLVTALPLRRGPWLYGHRVPLRSPSCWALARTESKKMKPDQGTPMLQELDGGCICLSLRQGGYSSVSALKGHAQPASQVCSLSWPLEVCESAVPTLMYCVTPSVWPGFLVHLRPSVRRLLG
jgi:hypothetical protein